MWAHPRSRGDHATPSCISAARMGSSPLARGPLDREPNMRIIDGLIPARAGTTREYPSARRGCRAHPRSRGDHSQACRPRSSRWGSSPLARGPRLLVQLLVRYIGLIPARAGTTIAVVLALDEIGAHPRSRGDHVRAGVHYCLRGGSSPLARGPRARVFAGDFAPGLIPARAGTTCLFLYIWCVGWAHPRSRGDH